MCNQRKLAAKWVNFSHQFKPLEEVVQSLGYCSHYRRKVEILGGCLSLHEMQYSSRPQK